MAVGELIAGVPEVLIVPMKILVYILQATGIFVIVYIIFNIINTLFNRKRNKAVENIAEDVREIKRLLRKKKK